MIALREKYIKEAVPGMQEKFPYKSVMAVPRIEKAVVNTGFGRMLGSRTGDDYKKTLEAIRNDLSDIAGQRVALTSARKSIAGFKVREGSPVGAKATLRGKRMYDFLDRLVHVVLPRSRDFRGLRTTAVDQSGNLTIGIPEHLFFPEVSPEKLRDIFGLEITITTTAKTKEEGLALFELLGFPFQK